MPINKITSTLDVKILAIVVTHNGSRWIDRCLSSLRNSRLRPDILVVDNCSSDDTTELIRSSYPSVELIESDINLGFASANNIGLERVITGNEYDYALLLNQDAWLADDSLFHLVATHRDVREFGIVSPIHLNGDGDLLDWNFTICISKPGNDGRRLYTDLLLKKQLQKVYKVHFVPAAAWLIHQCCLKKVGFFDHMLLPHYGEDANFTHRAKFHGFEIGVVPDSFIFHDREDRSGQLAQSSFSIDQSLLNFKIECSNLIDPDYIDKMNSLPRYHLLQAVKGILCLNFPYARKNWSIFHKMTRLKEVIHEHRKSYQNGAEKK